MPDKSKKYGAPICLECDSYRLPLRWEWTLEEFPTESAARSAVDAIRLTINRQTPQQLLKNVSVETLVKHYQEHELPDIFSKQKPATGSSDEHHKSYSTQYAYDVYLKKWVLPRWRSYRLSEVKAVDVEAWLKTMPLARGSRAKIRNLMSALFSHAIRWEWTERNPIQSVRQSAKRMRTPDVLTPEEIMALLKELPEPLRTAAELDAFTGLRRGELIGLQWEDVDFENLVIHVRRSVVMMVQGRSEDGSFRKGCTARRCFGRVSAQAEAHCSVQSRSRLGVCLADDERQASALARNSL